MSTPQDLTVLVGDTLLNIRVTILLLTENGYIFEKHKTGFYFPLGGRVQLNEVLTEACAREIMEELNLSGIELKIAGVLENFFQFNEKKYHELNFVHRGILDTKIDLNPLTSHHAGFFFLKPEDFSKHDIRPKALLDKITSEEPFFHVVSRD